MSYARNCVCYPNFLFTSFSVLCFPSYLCLLVAGTNLPAVCSILCELVGIYEFVNFLNDLNPEQYTLCMSLRMIFALLIPCFNVLSWLIVSSLVDVLDLAAFVASTPSIRLRVLSFTFFLDSVSQPGQCTSNPYASGRISSIVSQPPSGPRGTQFTLTATYTVCNTEASTFFLSFFFRPHLAPIILSDSKITNYTGVGQTLLTVFPKDNSTPWQYEVDFYSLQPGQYAIL